MSRISPNGYITPYHRNDKRLEKKKENNNKINKHINPI